MGGARPKAVIEDGEALSIAKFSRPDDRWNYPVLNTRCYAWQENAESKWPKAGSSRSGQRRTLDQEIRIGKDTTGYTRAR